MIGAAGLALAAAVLAAPGATAARARLRALPGRVPDVVPRRAGPAAPDPLAGAASYDLLAACMRSGLPVAAEAFADRAYHADGSLVSRSMPGSVLHDLDSVVARAVAMAREGTVEAIDGTRVAFEADTICVHGDTPGAAALAAAIRRGLEDAGVTVARLTR